MATTPLPWWGRQDPSQSSLTLGIYGEGHTMKNIIAALGATALLAAGCADMNTGQPMGDTSKNTLIGAGIGAVAGGLIGGDAKGAAIGGVVGAAGGYGWSKYMENKKSQMQQATAGSGVQVSQTQDNQL